MKEEKKNAIQFQLIYFLASKDVPSLRLSCASLSIPRLKSAAA
jgi:hypothetical protein